MNCYRLPSFAVLSALGFLAFNPAQAADCRFRGLNEAQCARVDRILSRWKGSTALTEVKVELAEAAPLPQDDQPNPDLDAWNARSLAKAEKAGPCYYDGEHGRVAVTTRAFELSDEGLARCLAGAVVHARYEAIEPQWVAEVGEHQAWVVRGGVATRVAVDRKLEEPAARSLWASFATRELLEASPDSAEAGRAIASTVDAPQIGSDAAVRKLLGFSEP